MDTQVFAQHIESGIYADTIDPVCLYNDIIYSIDIRSKNLNERPYGKSYMINFVEEITELLDVYLMPDNDTTEILQELADVYIGIVAALHLCCKIPFPKFHIELHAKPHPAETYYTSINKDAILHDFFQYQQKIIHWTRPDRTIDINDFYETTKEIYRILFGIAKDCNLSDVFATAINVKMFRENLEIEKQESANLQLTDYQKLILESYKRHEDMEPDISTERLLAMVEDDTGADVSEIIDALKAEQNAKPDIIGYVTLYYAITIDSGEIIYAKQTSDFQKPLTQDALDTLKTTIASYYERNFQLNITNVRFATQEEFDADDNEHGVVVSFDENHTEVKSY